MYIPNYSFCYAVLLAIVVSWLSAPFYWAKGVCAVAGAAEAGAAAAFENPGKLLVLSVCIC